MKIKKSKTNKKPKLTGLKLLLISGVEKTKGNDVVANGNTFAYGYVMSIKKDPNPDLLKKYCDLKKAIKKL